MTIHVAINGGPAVTPAKHPLIVPTQALADAIAEEWKTQKKFTPGGMPLTALAYTAIDRIAGQEGPIIEALMVYADTDTLSYRSTDNAELAKRQEQEWAPVLAWISKQYGAIWQTVTGIEPATQPDDMHRGIADYFRTLTPMQLSAACVLASIYSSLALTVAVLKNHLRADIAFSRSRLEEEVQAARWGRDSEADQKTARVKAEIEAAGRFLRLLEQ